MLLVLTFRESWSIGYVIRIDCGLIFTWGLITKIYIVWQQLLVVGRLHVIMSPILLLINSTLNVLVHRTCVTSNLSDGSRETFIFHLFTISHSSQGPRIDLVHHGVIEE
jgi:hypothetical protein